MSNQLTDRAEIVPCAECGCGAQYDFGDKPLCTVHAMQSGDWLAFLVRSTTPTTEAAHE